MGIGGLTADIDNQADADEKDDQVGAPVADEGKRQAFVGQRTGDDADINYRLQADQKSDARRQEHAEMVPRTPGDVNHANQDHQEGEQDGKGGDEAEFLSDNRENKVGVMFGEEAQFLPAIAESDAGNAAAAEGHHGMVGLKAFVLLGFLHVQPGINAPRAHGVMPEENSERDGPDAYGRQKISPPNPGDQQKDRADRAEQQRRSDIRLEEHQAEHQADDHSRHKHPAKKRRHVSLAAFAVIG